MISAYNVFNLFSSLFCCRSRNMSFRQNIPNQISLIHGMLHPADLLVIFMSLACQHDNISGFSVFDSLSDGFLTIADLYIISFRFCHTCLVIVDNILRFLKTGIVGGNDGQIR